MENDKQRFNRIKFIYEGLDNEKVNPNDIQDFFTQKYETWVFHNSNEKEFDNDIKKRIYSSGVDADGFELIKRDFIESQLIMLKRFDLDLLSENNRKKLNLYKNFLERNLSGTYVSGTFDIPFTSNKAQEVFNKLIEKFGNKNRGNLANYSFVYYAMVQDRHINNDSIKQKEFRDRLEEKNIIIEKIKAKNEIGAWDNKRLIYDSVIESFKK